MALGNVVKIHISEDTQRLIDEKVQAGWFKDASSLVEAALRSYFVSAPEVLHGYSREELDEKIAHGIDQLERGEGISAPDVFEKLRWKEERLRQSRK